METLHTPRISTLTIEVSVIKIGNNKMTLSVFDQLYQESPLDDNEKIIYPVWGKVNRSGDDYAIFIKNNELRKFLIPRKRHIKTFLHAVEMSTSNLRYDDDFYIDECNKMWNEYRKGLYWNVPKDLELFLHQLTAEKRDLISDEYNRIVAYNKALNESIDVLKSANQLFIAV